MKADIEIETQGHCRGEITLQAVRWSCIKDENCRNFSDDCKKTGPHTIWLDRETTYSIDNIVKNEEFVFSAKEKNSVGDSGWGETKSHISGYDRYDISKVVDKPGLVLVTAGATFCTIRFKPPCNYVGDLEYEILRGIFRISGSNRRKKYTRWATIICMAIEGHFLFN